MDYRLKKQIIIVLIYLAIFFLIGYGTYWIWFRHIPTCNDGIKNQNEEEIDCGGVCGSCEIKTLKNIFVLWTEALPINQGAYDLAAQIENPNPNYGASDISYEFLLYDSFGAVVASKKGNTFILPNKTAYIIEPNISAEQSVDHIKLVLGEPTWQILTGFEKDIFYIKNEEHGAITDNTGFYQSAGVLVNNSAFDFDKVSINVILYDAQNKPIGVNKTEVRTLLAGEDRYFLCKWFSKFLGETVRVDISVETNIFKNDNFMKRYGTSEKFKQQ